MSIPLRICVQKPLPEDLNIIQILHDKTQNSEHARAAFFKTKIWKEGSTIRIKFVDNRKTVEWTNINTLLSSGIPIDPLETIVRTLTPIEAVKKVITERIIPIVGLNIIFVDDGDAEIKVGFNPDTGAWSLIGTDCVKSKEPTTLNLGWLDVGTIIHEFGHALGMIHEHQSGIDNKIQWNEDAVYKWGEKTQGWDKTITYDNIIKKYDATLLNGSKFDSCSVMLYFFPAELTLNNKGTHQNNRLSSYDVEYLSKIYPKGKLSPEIFYKNIYKEDLFSNKNCTVYNNQQQTQIYKYSTEYLYKIFYILQSYFNYFKTTPVGQLGIENKILIFIFILSIILLILLFYRYINT